MSFKVAASNLIYYVRASQNYSLPMRLRIVVILLKILQKLGIMNFVLSAVHSLDKKNPVNHPIEQDFYNSNIVETLTFRCFQEIHVKHVRSWSSSAKISVLIPAFDPKTMSAGFFGAFFLAKALAKNGNRVSCYLIDDFRPDENALRLLFSKTEGLEDFYKYVNIYIRLIFK